ncbi:MAG: N-acetylmuramoyl-L-alanine amidase [Ignavibacteriales bacterium]|nr:N-acetylmuramoyl-L-alanine amidase [Ignavibacteriales bacterium]
MKHGWTILLVLIFAAGIATGQNSDLSGLTICIDPGHGGNNPANDRHVIPDPGTDFWESESNFQKALLIKALLQEQGAAVLLTRNTNTYPNDNNEPSLAARVQFANANNVDWFHSIHSNASGLANNTSINYTLMLVREKRPGGPSSSTGNGLGIPETQEAWDISGLMSPNIMTVLRTQRHSRFLDWTFYGGTNGGFSLGVLRGLLMPGQLSEGSFHDYFPETRRLMNNDYRKMEAYALRNSFLQFFGVPADSFGIVAGIQTSAQTGKPINHARVRLLPDNIVYEGDGYNNGFYMFDKLKPGTYTIRFETPLYAFQEVPVTVSKGATVYLDRSLPSAALAHVTYASPSAKDTLYPVNATFGLSFSSPMDPVSVEKGFSVTPATPGTMSWFNNFTTLIFRPAMQLLYSNWYTYQIGGDVRTIEGGSFDGDGDGAAGGVFLVTFRTNSQPVSTENGGLVPAAFALRQNHPNPFNPSTAIEFDLPRELPVRMVVYTTVGKPVATLMDGQAPAGRYRLVFDAADLPTGVYYYRLEAGEFVETKKMLLLK